MGISISPGGDGSSTVAVTNWPARMRPSRLSTRPSTRAVCWLGSIKAATWSMVPWSGGAWGSALRRTVQRTGFGTAKSAGKSSS